jgi:hydrogenase-1 operon protein HyaF
MTRLSDIPVTVIDGGQEPAGTLSLQAIAVLGELQNLLGELAASGKGGSIDVRSLPLAPGDYALLKDFLGEGEVYATIDALGVTEVRETAIAGIWWVIHRNKHEEVLADCIEVCEVPDIMKSQSEDIQQAIETLRSRLTGLVND